MPDPILLLANEQTANQSAYTTEAVAFTAGEVVELLVGAAALTGNVSAPTITTPSGIVFTRSFDWGLGGEEPGPRLLFTYRAEPEVTVTETVLITFPAGGNDIDECHYIFGQHDPELEILQIIGSTQNTFQTSLDSIAMSRFDSASSGVLFMLLKGSPRALDNPNADGFTILGETAGAVYGTHMLWKGSNDQTPTAAWTSGADPDPSVHAIGVAFELGVRTPGNITPTKVPRGKWNTGAGATTQTHAFLRLRARHKYLIAVTNRVSSGSAGTVTPSTVGNVLSFTQIGTVNTPGVLRTTLWEVTIGATDFQGVITFTAGASQAVWGGDILELGGADADTPHVRVATGQTSGSQASLTMTFAVPTDANNEIVAVVGIISNTATITVDATPAGYEIVETNPVGSPSTLQQWLATLDGSDQAVVANFAPNANGAGIAVELAPAVQDTVEAEVTSSLPALTQQATARAVVEADIASDLPALTQAATAERGPNLADVASTLPALIQAATGERGATEGEIESVLPALQSVAEATASVRATATSVLPALEQFATDAELGAPVDGPTAVQLLNPHNDVTTAPSANEARVTSG